MTDEAIEGHLRGHHTLGVYPMLADSTCHFLAAAFDKETWRTDAEAFLAACRSKEVPAAVERSRSGNGSHVWIFFAGALPAALARRLGSHLLTEAMENNPDIGFKSYDRFFPSQDTDVAPVPILGLYGRAKKATRRLSIRPWTGRTASVRTSRCSSIA